MAFSVNQLFFDSQNKAFVFLKLVQMFSDFVQTQFLLKGSDPVVKVIKNWLLLLGLMQT